MSRDYLQDPRAFRSACRTGHHTTTSRGAALGYVQCNLVVVPMADAFDLLVYCQRNQKACPVLEVTDVGDPEPKILAPGADLRTDLARYAVYRNGERLPDALSVEDLWRDDLVGFLIGSGITFDLALQEAGIPTYRDRWVLNTKIPTIPAGSFRGPLVVTMRWLRPEHAIRAVQVTSRYPFNHGAPVHIGDPNAIGADLENPLFGGHVPELPSDRVPVFWACGVTPQAAALAARIELMITHAPGHSFVTDLPASALCIP